MGILIVLIIQGIIFGGFCAFIASEKNRDATSWFILGFLFSILAVLALVAIPKENTAEPHNTVRTCTYCAEQIKEQAKICRFCQKDLPELNPNLPSKVVSEGHIEDLRQKIINLRNEGFSYYLIAQHFNEENISTPDVHTESEVWSPELVKFVEHGD